MSSLPKAQEAAVFVDTSAFYAALDRDDRWHSLAAEGFITLVQQRRPVYTTNLVVAETYVLILTRLNKTLALRWLKAIDIPTVFQAREDHIGVRELLLRQSLMSLSYADAFSFQVMEALGIRQAFTFDRHFQVYGWDVFPSPLL